MDFNIITGYPAWYILLCIMAGILASMILYFRERKSEFPVWLKRLLGVIRFMLVTLITFLLLSPLLKLSSHNLEKPLIVIAQDNSMSVVLNEDSTLYRTTYRASLNQLVEDLQDDYEVRLFTFGDEVMSVNTPSFDTLAFDERETDMSSLFEMMDVRFMNRNIGALIIASDGIYNKGFNPVYHAADISYPIYTIGLGDTSERRDALLKRVFYNRIAFQGNDFPVEIIINARKMPGTTLNLSISEGGKNIQSKQVLVQGSNFSTTLRLNLPAEDPGIHHFIVRVISNKDEITLENNHYDLFVEVLQSKQKILILANSPHPDISAIKDAIKSNINYEVDDILIDEFTGPPQQYSLVILHQLPSFSPQSPNLIKRLQSVGVPLLIIIGEQTDLREFNKMEAGIQLNAFNRSEMNEALPVLNDAFTTYNVSAELGDLIPFLPPMNTPFARYNISNSAMTLFYQKIGDIESSDPLWILQSGRKTKTGVITGTGLWKWKIKSWLISGDHQLFNEMITKNVQFLAVKDDKRQFHVNAKNRFPENTALTFEAELYNESFEPVSDPDVRMEIVDDEGNAYEYIFSREGDAYTLEAGRMGVGSYSFKAETQLGDKIFTDQGGFVVTPVIAEQISLRAAHDMLEELSGQQGGLLVPIEQLDTLASILEGRGDVKPLIHAEKKYIEFIDVWWVLLVILGLLGLEWFLRKWSGSY